MKCYICDSPLHEEDDDICLDCSERVSEASREFGDEGLEEFEEEVLDDM